MPRKAAWLFAALLLGQRGAPAASPRHTLVAVFAHPDDELLVGPLLSAEARQGVTVYLILATAGENGNAHTDIPAGPALAARRTEEARCSAKALGIEPPIILGFEDGQLGHFARPAPAYTARFAAALRDTILKLHADAIVTFGPEGADGHPDHRIVNAVVTQLVQAGGPGIPKALFFPGIPSDRASEDLGSGAPWLPTDTTFLTVRVPYQPADIEATRAAFACHQTQISAPGEIGEMVDWYQQAFRGTVYLRPWFGDVRGSDLFSDE